MITITRVLESGAPLACRTIKRSHTHTRTHSYTQTLSIVIKVFVLIITHVTTSHVVVAAQNTPSPYTRSPHTRAPTELTRRFYIRSLCKVTPPLCTQPHTHTHTITRWDVGAPSRVVF